MNYNRLIFTFILLVFVFNINAQTTYTGSPSTPGSAACPNTNVSTGVSGSCTTATTFQGNTIKAYVGSISGNNATIYLVKCDGTNFASGSYFLKTNDVCGSVVKSGNITSGASIAITVSLSHTGTQNYRITFTSNSSGLKYYTNNLTIAGNCNTSNNVNPSNISFSNITTSAAKASWPSVSGAIGYEINYTVCSASNYSAAMTATSSGNSVNLTGLTAGTQYKMQIRTVFSNNCYSNWSNSSSCFTTTTPCGMPNGSNSYASNITTNGFTAHWQSVSRANYYKIKVKKCSQSNYDNSPTFETSSNSTSTVIAGLDCGECYQFQVQAVCSSGGGEWSTSNPTGIQLLKPAMPNNNAVTYSDISQTSFKATWPAITGAIRYRVNYTTCAGSFILQDLSTSTNSITISGLSAKTQYKIQIRAEYANQCFSEWSPSASCVTTSSNSCVVWQGTPPTGEELIAAEYLCSKGIIDSRQNASDNSSTGIMRQDIAKIGYNGLYINIAEGQRSSPAVNFPVPFLDMQKKSEDVYWYKPAKVLTYLQFNDDRTPFDRDFINFRPEERIQRHHAIKLLLEAFNIPPSSDLVPSKNPFSDISTTDEMYPWVKKANELGFILGNSNCAEGICVFPDSYMTRNDAFLLLYRVLVATNINRPTLSQLNDISNYYQPGNYRVENMSSAPDLAQGNFNHYQKTSFSIDGRSAIPLDFTHTYNSFLTELPEDFFRDKKTAQSFTPMGMGWTHTYNIYAIKVDGYTIGSYTESPKIIFFYPTGSINVFDYNTSLPAEEGSGIHDLMTKTNISGGERITITSKDQIKYVFENYYNGKYYFLKEIKDRNDNGIKINWSNYAPAGVPSDSLRYRISAIQEIFYNNATGRGLSFNYASTYSQYLASVTDNSIGRTIKFKVSLAKENLTEYTDAKGGVTNYSYLPISVNDTYNKRHLLEEIQLPKGNKIRNTYEQRKLKSSQTFAQNGVVSSTTKVNWKQDYGPNADYKSTSSVTDPQNRNTSYSLNSLGDATNIEVPGTKVTINSYDTGKNVHLPTSITADGITTTMSYDTKGNLLSTTKNGITNSYTYTNKNDIASHTDGRKYTTIHSYDSKGNLTKVQRPAGGGSVTIGRNNYGQVSSVTNPSGIQTSYGYNNNGLVNEVNMPLGNSTSATYDNASRLLSITNANSKTSSFKYDVNDNLIQSTDANNQIVRHEYDANGNHLTITNPKNETHTNTYNFNDDLLASESFGSHTKSYTYNADGTLATYTRGNGTFNYTYHSTTGRLTSDGYTSYGYDARGNVASITNNNGTLKLYYDNSDRLTSQTDYYGQTVAYNYDNNSNVTTVTYPGDKKVNYVYDDNNRCTSVTDWNGKTTTYTYLTDDRISKITLPNGSYTDYTYDVAARPTGIQNKKSNGTVISGYTFTLDAAGNHLSETINEPSITAGLQNISNDTRDYGQYPFNRIQSAGNTNFTHNTAGGIIQAGANPYTYDINDNLLTAPNSTFSYDGAGNRRSKTVSGTTTRYVLNILGMSQVLMENNGSNDVQNYYVYGPTGILYRVSPNNTNQYYHYDFRGSTTAITNESQVVTHSYSYDPYGNVLASTEADFNPYRYVGQYGVAYETDNLVFMRARYYDPTLGRFLSEDPVWALNLYPYADINPVRLIDSDGRSPGDAKTMVDIIVPFFGGSGKLYEFVSNGADVIMAVNEATLANNKNDFILSILNSSQGAVIGIVAGAGPIGAAVGWTAANVNQDVNTMANSSNIYDAVRNLDKNGSVIWKISQKIGDTMEKGIDVTYKSLSRKALRMKLKLRNRKK